MTCILRHVNNNNNFTIFNNMLCSTVLQRGVALELHRTSQINNQGQKKSRGIHKHSVAKATEKPKSHSTHSIHIPLQSDVSQIHPHNPSYLNSYIQTNTCETERQGPGVGDGRRGVTGCGGGGGGGGGGAKGGGEQPCVSVASKGWVEVGVEVVKLRHLYG